MHDKKSKVREQQLEYLAILLENRETARAVTDLMLLNPVATDEDLKTTLKMVFDMFDMTVSAYVQLTENTFQTQDTIASIVESALKK